MSKKWFKAAGIRAIKTMAQAAVAMIGTSVVLTDVSWQVTVSAAILAGVLSMLTSVAGLPEVDKKQRTLSAGTRHGIIHIVKRTKRKRLTFRYCCSYPVKWESHVWEVIHISAYEILVIVFMVITLMEMIRGNKK